MVIRKKFCARSPFPEAGLSYKGGLEFSLPLRTADRGNNLQYLADSDFNDSCMYVVYIV